MGWRPAAAWTAIHRAGGPAILAECERLRAERFPDGLPTRNAVATYRAFERALGDATG